MKLLNKLSYTSFCLHVFLSVALIAALFSNSNKVFEVIAFSALPLFITYSISKVFLKNENLKYKNLAFLFCLILSLIYSSLNLNLALKIADLIHINTFLISILFTFVSVFLSFILIKNKKDRNYLVSLILVFICSLYSVVNLYSLNHHVKTQIELYHDLSDSLSLNNVKINTQLFRFNNSKDLNTALLNTSKSLEANNTYSSKVIQYSITDSISALSKDETFINNPTSFSSMIEDYKNEVMPIVILNPFRSTFILDTNFCKDSLANFDNIKNQFLSYIIFLWLMFLFMLNSFHYLLNYRRSNAKI